MLQLGACTRCRSVMPVPLRRPVELDRPPPHKTLRQRMEGERWDKRRYTRNIDTRRGAAVCDDVVYVAEEAILDGDDVGITIDGLGVCIIRDGRVTMWDEGGTEWLGPDDPLPTPYNTPQAWREAIEEACARAQLKRDIKEIVRDVFKEFFK